MFKELYEDALDWFEQLDLKKKIITCAIAWVINTMVVLALFS